MAGIGAMSTVTAVAADAYNIADNIDDESIISSLGRGLDMPDYEEERNQSEEPDPVRRGSKITVSIETIILSALLFIGILAWFEFLRSWYENTFTLTDQERRFDAVIHRFWYAIFITALVTILIYIVLCIADR